MAIVVTQGQRSADGSGINNFNPNTGQRLSAGQSVGINPPTAAQQNSDNHDRLYAQQHSTAITPESLNPVSSTPTVPTPSTPSSLGGDAITRIQAQLATLQAQKEAQTAAGYGPNEQPQKDPVTGSIVPKVAPTDTAGGTLQKYLDQAKGLFQAPPNTADIYQKDYAASGVAQKQTDVNNYTNQLNAITAKSQADSLSLTGQGRGVTDVIIGGQQAQVQKEAAIKSLPIAALLSAAQGDLKTAQDHLDTLFKIHSEDALAQNTYQTKLADFALQLADKADQRLLDEKKTKDAQNFSLLTNNLNYAQSLSTMALNSGQHNLAGKIMSLDPKSPTYSADIAKIGGQITQNPLDVKLKNLQMANIQSEIVNRNKKVVGTETEKKSAAISKFSAAFVPGAKMADGTPTLDSDNFATPVAFKAALNDASNYGLTRQNFITQFGHLIYNGAGEISDKYGLTPIEKKLVTGAL